MSYKRRVEIERDWCRIATERDKKRKAAASKAGREYLGKRFDPKPLEAGQPSLLKRIWDSMSNWRSKKSIAAEAKRKTDAEKEKAKA